MRNVPTELMSRTGGRSYRPTSVHISWFHLMTDKMLISLTNELLQWQDGAHAVLSDWLEDNGYGDTFRHRGGIHRHDGIVLALLELGAIGPLDVIALRMRPADMQLALENFAAGQFSDAQSDLRQAIELTFEFQQT